MRGQRIYPKYLDEKKLRKQYQKTTDKLNSEIDSLLPIVLERPDRKEDLHSLRKACKSLRYLIEAGQEGFEKISSLETWQNRLGEIHDLDVSIDFLSDRKQAKKTKSILRLLRSKRKNEYDGFVFISRDKGSHKSELITSANTFC